MGWAASPTNGSGPEAAVEREPKLNSLGLRAAGGATGEIADGLDAKPEYPIPGCCRELLRRIPPLDSGKGAAYDCC